MIQFDYVGLAVGLCGGYNYDSASIRRPFDGRPTKVIKVTVT